VYNQFGLETEAFLYPAEGRCRSERSAAREALRAPRRGEKRRVLPVTQTPDLRRSRNGTLFAPPAHAGNRIFFSAQFFFESKKIIRRPFFFELRMVLY
jgi:hypothetical protein